MAAQWHALTLEELMCLTAPKSPTDPTEDSESNRGTRGQRVIGEDDCAGAQNDGFRMPPKAKAQDDLNSYIILRWCPWYSRAFGVLCESNLSTLAVKLLTGTIDSKKPRISLELLTAVTLVLTQPNVPHRPSCADPSVARSFLFRD